MTDYTKGTIVIMPQNRNTTMTGWNPEYQVSSSPWQERGESNDFKTLEEAEIFAKETFKSYNIVDLR